MDKELQAIKQRMEMSPQDVFTNGALGNIDYLKSIINQAISDYAQLGDRGKNQKYADFVDDSTRRGKGFARAAVGPAANIIDGVKKTGQAVNQLTDPTLYMTPEQQTAAALQVAGSAQTGGLPFAPSGVGIAGSILPLKKFLETFEAGSGVVNKIVRNSDKSVKHVLTEDDAVEYYLNSINHLNKTKLKSGRDAYINPNDPGNYYSGDWSTPDAKMFASFASESKGSGKFNDILTGIFLDNGLYKPSTISRVDVANRPTLEALSSGVPIKDTLLGHSSDVISKNLGGVLGKFEVTPGQYNDDLLLAKRRGINPTDYEQMKNYYESLSSFEKPTHLYKMFEDVTLKSPVDFKK